MSFSVCFDNAKSTPKPIIVGTLLLGLSSPIVSFFAWRGALYHLYETNDMVQVVLFLFFVVIWPIGWISAMFLGALNPLFGKTIININNEHIEIKKYLFSLCWKYTRYANNESTILSILHQSEQRPVQSGANQIGSGCTTCTVYRLIIRDKLKQCILHESYNENEEKILFNSVSNLIKKSQYSC